jgi:uncharacterized membrane protein YvlD (DUF360 family)
VLLGRQRFREAILVILTLPISILNGSFPLVINAGMLALVALLLPVSIWILRACWAIIVGITGLVAL